MSWGCTNITARHDFVSPNDLTSRITYIQLQPIPR
ncbi:hypothetical protein LINPERHAP2_LOCUS3639 [Linum perenne]